jgi:SAM-dependent methyltransferase
MPPDFDGPVFDRIARPYRWLEYLSFGPMLERCRLHFLPQLVSARRALVLGDGDGRFLARLLETNPLLHADVVDLSPAMLELLQARAARIGALHRITLHCADALAFDPSGTYDLVVTHFFLDCFTTEELTALAAGIQSHLSADARWIVSEFAIPPGPMAFPAKCIVRNLYAAFRILTGLRVRQLPDHAEVLSAIGLLPSARRNWLGGMLVSELWETPGNRSHR